MNNEDLRKRNTNIQNTNVSTIYALKQVSSTNCLTKKIT
jgi:hypothetical protein